MSNCVSLLLIQLLVSFQIYSNISRLSLFARGNVLPLVYFYPSVALNGGMCRCDLAIYEGIMNKNEQDPFAEMKKKWEEAKQRWNALTPEQQEEERKKTAAYDERILAESGYFDDEED